MFEGGHGNPPKIIRQNNNLPIKLSAKIGAAFTSLFKISMAIFLICPNKKNIFENLAIVETMFHQFENN